MVRLVEAGCLQLSFVITVEEIPDRPPYVLLSLANMRTGFTYQVRH